MIDLLVDEAYAFDYLSILERKIDNSEQDWINFEKIYLDIESQIGSKLFREIINSIHYKKLVDINSHIYSMVDKIRAGDTSITAKDVDDANISRYRSKVNLQKQFFSADLFEKKTNI